MSELRAQVVRLAQQQPAIRAHLVPLLREAKKVNPKWRNFNLWPKGRKYIKAITTVLETFTPHNLQVLLKGDVGYEEVKAKFGTGNPKSLARGMKGIVKTPKGMNVFVGTVGGTEVILTDPRFKF